MPSFARSLRIFLASAHDACMQCRRNARNCRIGRHLRMKIALTLARWRAFAPRIFESSKRTQEPAACIRAASAGRRVQFRNSSENERAARSISKAFPFRTSAGRLRVFARGGLVVGVERGRRVGARVVAAGAAEAIQRPSCGRCGVGVGVSGAGQGRARQFGRCAMGCAAPGGGKSISPCAFGATRRASSSHSGTARLGRSTTSTRRTCSAAATASA